MKADFLIKQLKRLGIEKNENYNAIVEALDKEKSNLTIKGDLVKQVYITSSMGVSYKIKMDKSI